MSTTSPPSSGGQTVDLGSLSLAQLRTVKTQLDEEIEHLTSSHQKLRLAQGKFRDCIKSVREGVRPENGDKQILVPLTTSLYVPGRLAKGDKVLVDVGTGFYVEKTAKDAVSFYTVKVEELEKNLKDLEQVVQGKSNSVRVVEEVFRQKMASSNSTATATS